MASKDLKWVVSNITTYGGISSKIIAIWEKTWEQNSDIV
jgi:hypothetical protein